MCKTKEELISAQEVREAQEIARACTLIATPDTSRPTVLAEEYKFIRDDLKESMPNIVKDSSVAALCRGVLALYGAKEVLLNFGDITVSIERNV